MGKSMVEQLRPELEKAFEDVPLYGEIGFRVFFKDGETIRIEYSTSLSQQIKPAVKEGPIGNDEATGQGERTQEVRS